MTKAVYKKKDRDKETKVKEPAIIEVDTTPKTIFNFNQIHNHKFEFTLLDKNNKFLHNPVECKDYFQDVFWTEYRRKDGNQFGLYWKPGMLDINTGTFKLAISGGIIDMEEKIPHLKKFLNSFERALKFKQSKVYKTKNSKMIVVEFSKQWTDYPSLLSAFTSLIRISGKYDKKDKARDYLKHIFNNRSDVLSYMKVEVNRLNYTYKKMLALLDGKKPTHEWKTINDMGVAHGMGIVGDHSFPTSEE